MSSKEKTKMLDTLGELSDDLEDLEKKRKELSSQIRAKKKEITTLLKSINNKEELDEESDE